MDTALRTLLESIADQLNLGKLKTVRRLAGGSINNVFHVSFQTEQLLVKWNPNAPEDFFSCEQDGLISLQKHLKEAIVPDIVYSGNDFLVLRYIVPTAMKCGHQEQLGHALASLHKHSSGKFGYHRSNFIGSLSQDNRVQDEWWRFLAEHRWLPLIRSAGDLLDQNDRKSFDILMTDGSDLFPEEVPSLLHGDLWSGNVFASAEGVVFIDPAVYYGHREMDIAMTRLFGGFTETFYQAYNESFKLEQGWRKRIGLCNLYPLLVHLNLFGLSYRDEIRSVLRTFT